MGLKNHLITGLWIFLGSTLLNVSLADTNPTLTTQPWPSARPCKTCIIIQFGKLEMRLPPAELGKILVIGSEGSGLDILPGISNERRVGIHFLAISRDKLLGAFQKLGFLEKLGITTIEQFFEALGKPSKGNKPLETLRYIEQVDTADSYLKTAKESVQVYWIKSSAPDGHQLIYFVINGEGTVYLLAGNITQEFYETVLSNLRIAEIP